MVALFIVLNLEKNLATLAAVVTDFEFDAPPIIPYILMYKKIVGHNFYFFFRKCCLCYLFVIWLPY